MQQWNAKHCQFAATVMTLDEIRQAIPPALIDDVEGLQLPGLNYHPAQRQLLRDVIATHICETFHIAYYKSNTMMCERFRLPRPKFLKNQGLLQRWEHNDEAIAFMEDVRKFHVIATWPTVGDALQEMKPQSEMLQLRLRPRPPEGGCVKFNRFQEAYGPRLARIQDAVTVCPRINQLEEALVLLLDIRGAGLEKEEEAWQVLAVLKSIQGEDADYVEATAEAISHGSNAILEDWIPAAFDDSDTMIQKDDCIVMVERATFKALCSHQPRFLQDTIDMQSIMDLLEEDPLSNCLLMTKSGLKVQVLASHYRGMALNTSLQARIRSVQSFQSNLDLLAASGLIPWEQAEKHRKLNMTFLTLLGDDGEGYNAARQAIMHPDYFKPGPPDVMAVANALRITANFKHPVVFGGGWS